MNNFLSSVWSGVVHGVAFLVVFALTALALHHYQWQDITLGSLVVAFLQYVKSHIQTTTQS